MSIEAFISQYMAASTARIRELEDSLRQIKELAQVAKGVRERERLRTIKHNAEVALSSAAVSRKAATA